jgi:poly [ADP-ribose] polymerase
MIDYTAAKYDADQPVREGKGHSTRGVGGTMPDPEGARQLEDGLHVPCGKPLARKGHRGALLYNEYIVYNEAQVQMK